MESLERSKSVVALGKRLAALVSDDDDLASAWMSHLIAERMDAVEVARPEDRALAEEACVQEIYRLWQHRYAAPPRVNPLRDVEPIARVLAALDPSGDRYRYNREALGLASEEDCKTSNDWLKLALQLDRSSNDLIRFALQRGASEAFASEGFKAALADALGSGVDVDFEVRIVRFVVDDEDFQSGFARARESIAREKVGRLRRLAELATQLACRLEEEVGSMVDATSAEDSMTDLPFPSGAPGPVPPASPSAE